MKERIDELKAKYAALDRRMAKLKTDLEQLQKRTRVWSMKKSGYSNAEIADAVGLSENSIRLLLKVPRK